MSLNLTKKVIQFLKNNNEKKFTAREIAIWILKTFPEECNQKKTNSTAIVNPIISDNDLIQQIVAEIGAQRPRIQKISTKIKTTDSRPRKYYFSKKNDQEEINNNEESILEKDLYPIFINYLKTEFGLYSKRIDEKKSKNIRGYNGNQWLYPDIVALENLTLKWNHKVSKCINEYGDKKAKLWSFEIKKLINNSNVRRSFFQTVSNSSWANYGYLVATELEEKTKIELRMLCSSHGIGFILLDINNSNESQILIPAKEKESLDWEAINRIANVNKDFSNYIEEISYFCLTGKAKTKDWD